MAPIVEQRSEPRRLVDRLLNKWAVERETSLDITTIYRRMKAGTFPQPVRVGKAPSRVAGIRHRGMASQPGSGNAMTGIRRAAAKCVLGCGRYLKRADASNGNNEQVCQATVRGSHL